MKFLSKYFWIIFIVIAIIAGIYQYPKLNESFSVSKSNYLVRSDGKVIPLTILSEEDSKKPCQNCHIK